MKQKVDVKKLWKRNQIMITALALMIAIAGYLNFTGKQIDEEELFTTSAQFEEADANLVEENVTASADLNAGVAGEALMEDAGVIDESAADGAIDESAADLYDISLEDVENYTEIPSLDDDVALYEDQPIDEEMDETMSEESVTDLSAETADAADAAENSTEVPGEAVFTNTMAVTTLAEANLVKEQTRAQNKAALLEIINNSNLSEAAKQEAVESMISLTDIAQKECDTLVMLEAKGFPDAVVSINGEYVDVCIGMSELTQAQIAQIEDIVKRKTGVSAENIVISPVGK